ncbi:MULTISPECIES: hypothetical protein [Amycolatopsis]|nr:hypothetical protein [Amycolatopsis tucumanensis]
MTVVITNAKLGDVTLKQLATTGLGAPASEPAWDTVLASTR